MLSQRMTGPTCPCAFQSAAAVFARPILIRLSRQPPREPSAHHQRSASPAQIADSSAASPEEHHAAPVPEDPDASSGKRHIHRERRREAGDFDLRKAATPGAVRDIPLGKRCCSGQEPGCPFPATRLYTCCQRSVENRGKGCFLTGSPRIPVPCWRWEIATGDSGAHHEILAQRDRKFCHVTRIIGRRQGEGRYGKER